MKNIILSAGNETKVYSVPDEVADNLRKYCIEFCDKWLINSPDAEKYRKNGVLCYNESTFIDYLNTYIFPHQESYIVENLGWIDDNSELPPLYANCPQFNF